MISEPKLTLFSGSSHPELAHEVAKELKIKLSDIILSRFACGEIYARPVESVRNCDVFVLQTGTYNSSENLMELFIMLDAFKRSFAYKTHVVMPHFPYARQDRVAEPREPISAKLVADLISRAGADHVITLSLHSDQEQGFFDFPVDNIFARYLFIDFFKKKKLKNLVVVAPDVGSAKEARRLSREIDADIAILNKDRRAHNVAETLELVGNVKDKTCIVLDDIVDTAGSVCNAKKVLEKEGANKDVYLAATHPVLSKGAVEKLKKARFKEIVFTNSIPVPKVKRLPNMKIISIAPLLARIIRNVHEGKPVTPILKPM